MAIWLLSRLNACAALYLMSTGSFYHDVSPSILTNVCEPSHYFDFVLYTNTGAPAANAFRFAEFSIPFTPEGCASPNEILRRGFSFSASRTALFWLWHAQSAFLTVQYEQVSACHQLPRSERTSPPSQSFFSLCTLPFASTQSSILSVPYLLKSSQKLFRVDYGNALPFQLHWVFQRELLVASHQRL